MSSSDPQEFVVHPYLNGYSVLPALRKISHAEIFQYSTEHHVRCLKEKAIASQSQVVHTEYKLNAELRSAVYEFLLENYPVSLKPSPTLESLVEQMQEDVVIHALAGDEDWMAYGHVSLPSGWRPEEKVGKPLRELHAPIPGMNLDTSRKLVEAMVYHGPFERFIWSVVHEDKLNFHPDQPRADFSLSDPVLFLKIERQVTLGFPEQGGALFLLCERLLTADQIDRVALANSIRKMNLAERTYKGLENCENGLLPWLEGTIT